MRRILRRFSRETSSTCGRAEARPSQVSSSFVGAWEGVRFRGAAFISAIIFVSTFLLTAPPASALSQSEIQRKLSEIEIKVRDGQRSLEEVRVRVKQGKARLEKLSAERKALAKEQDSIQRRINELSQKRKIMLGEVEAARIKRDAARARSGKRIRSMYEVARGDLSFALLAAGTARDIERAMTYLRFIRQYDTKIISELQSAEEGLKSREAQLNSAVLGVTALHKRLESNGEELESRMEEERQGQDALRNQGKAAAKLVGDLQREAAKLDKVLQAMLSQPAESEAPPETVGSTQPKPVEPEAPGLFSAGRLVSPVRGKVVAGYGKVQVEGFDEEIFNKGNEFSVQEGAEIRAVAPGAVVFVGQLPGFGTVVIVDHSNREHSLYGRLGKALVSRGERVAGGDVLGVASTPDKRERNFYFEVRRLGEAVDPGPILRRAG